MNQTAALVFLVLLVAMANPDNIPKDPTDVARVRATEPSALRAADAFAAWGDTLSIDSRVWNEMVHFANQNGEFSQDYETLLAAGIRKIVFAKATDWLRSFSGRKCEPTGEVSYLEPGFAKEFSRPPSRESEEDFEKGFIETEFGGCIQSGTAPAADVLALYVSPEIRKKMSTRVERIWQQDGTSCVETKGVKPIMGPTLVCNKLTEYHAPGLAVQHAQVVSNSGKPDYQPVYFKESLKLLVEYPGGIAVYYINYSRSFRVRGFMKTIGSKKIIEAQQAQILEVERQLNKND